jgi:hypothetical protein
MGSSNCHPSQATISMKLSWRKGSGSPLFHDSTASSWNSPCPFFCGGNARGFERRMSLPALRFAASLQALEETALC